MALNEPIRLFLHTHTPLTNKEIQGYSVPSEVKVGIPISYGELDLSARSIGNGGRYSGFLWKNRINKA